MNPTLAELEQARSEFESAVLPVETRELLEREIRRLEEIELERRALDVGDVIPDAELLNARGESLRLSDLRQGGPVVLVFYRGGWCTFCRIHLRGMQRVAATIEGLKVRLVAISPELPDRSEAIASDDGLRFPLLQDPGNRFASACGVAFDLTPAFVEMHRHYGLDFAVLNGSEGANTLPVPAVFVVQADGTIAWRQINPDYKRRADPDAVVLAVVDALSGS